MLFSGFKKLFGSPLENYTSTHWPASNDNMQHIPVLVLFFLFALSLFCFIVAVVFLLVFFCFVFCFFVNVVFGLRTLLRVRVHRCACVLCVL